MAGRVRRPMNNVKETASIGSGDLRTRMVGAGVT